MTEQLHGACATLVALNKKNKDNLRLNKLLYFIQAEYLLQYNEPAFKESIEAWLYGPVVPEVYKSFKKNPDIFNERIWVDPKLEKIVDKVNYIFSDVETMKIVDLTHQYNPWIDAWDKGRSVNVVIAPSKILEFHKQKNSLGKGVF